MYFDRRLWGFTAGLRARIAAAALVGLVAVTVGVARLALLGWLLGGVLAGAPPGDLLGPLALVALLMVLRGVLEHWRTMVAHRTAAAVQARLRRVVHDQVVGLGPGYATGQRSGALSIAMVDSIEQLETFFGQYLPQVLVAALTPPLLFLCVAFVDLPVATTLFGFAVVALVAPAAFHRWDSRNAKHRQASWSAFASELLDSIQGLATLKAFGQSGARARRLAEKAEEVCRATMWVLGTNVMSRGITDTAIALGAAAALALGGYRVVEGTMSLPELLVVLMLGIEVFRPLRDLRAVLHNGMVGTAAAESLFQLLDARPPVGEPVAPRELPGEPSIRFEAIRFAYPASRRLAHDGLDFAVAPGERVGVVGSSGAGKSSIVKLLLRFHDPDAGRVLIGGADLRELALTDIRARIAVVHQDTYLFHGTIEDNIRMGRPAATHEQVVEAARAANIHDFVERLPDGYATLVGERGIKLSGGQRQRVAIARALLKDAPVLVLDEALSAVDAENEAVIQEALGRLMRGRTTLVLAHRLSSVIDCDRILVLEAGRVVEAGPHHELMRRGGLYARLMAEQAHDARPAGVAASPIPAAEEPAEEASTPASPPPEGVIAAEGMGWPAAVAALMRLILPWKGKLALTFLLGVLRVLAFIGVGALGALVVLALKRGEAFDLLVAALLVVAPAAGLLHWLESWIAHDMAFKLLARMRIDLFNKLDALAPAYLVRRRSGDLMAVATQDIELVEYFFAHTVAPAFVAVLVPSVVLGILAVAGWPMAAALLPFLAVVALSPLAMRRRVDRLASRSREALGELTAHAVDTVQGLAEVVAYGQGERRGRAFQALAERHVENRLPYFADLTRQGAILEVATGLGGLAVVVAGGALVAAGSLEAGILPLMTLLAMAAFLPVSEIAQVSRQLADTLGATRRLHAVHAERPAVEDGPGVGDPGPGADVAFEGVGFRYPGTASPALAGVDLALPTGRTVALVGPSGAGKTTVAHLIMRFWDPTGGTIRFNGRDLRDFRLDDLRARVALVAQDTYLFNDTLGANILIARPDAGADELVAAIKHAALDELVASLPDGLETRVGERGARLSGGQRQRIAIARAFLKDAPLLVLDEATSHLDAVSEAAVRSALDRLRRGRTTLVIAHRLSTVREADLIVVLDGGRVVESGRHEELLERNGLYARLVAHQLAGGWAAAAAD